MTKVLPSREDMEKIGEWRRKILEGEIGADTPPPVDFFSLARESDGMRSTMDVDFSKFDEFSYDVPIVKTDEEKRLVFGWASVAKRKDGTLPADSDGDEIHDLDDFEKAAYDFVVESRVGGEMHVRKGVGTMVESVVFTPDKLEKMGLSRDALPTAWWVGFRVEDERVWEAVKKGRYKMFSVHGRGIRKELED